MAKTENKKQLPIQPVNVPPPRKSDNKDKKSDKKDKKSSSNKRDPNYKGKPTSKKLNDGPVEERKCTDVFCFLLFVVFWVGVGLIAVKCYQQVDDVMSITYVYDQFGSNFSFLSVSNPSKASLVKTNTLLFISSRTTASSP